MPNDIFDETDSLERSENVLLMAILDMTVK